MLAGTPPDQGHKATRVPPLLLHYTFKLPERSSILNLTRQGSHHPIMVIKSKHKKQVIKFLWLQIKPSWSFFNTRPQLREVSPGDRSSARPSDGGISHCASSLYRRPCAVPGSPGSNPHMLPHHLLKEPTQAMLSCIHSF